MVFTVGLWVGADADIRELPLTGESIERGIESTTPVRKDRRY